MRIRHLLPSPVSLLLVCLLTHPGLAQAPAAATEGEDAAKLVERADDALRKRDFKTASELLDQARSINPTQENLAGAYAALSYDRGNWTEAILNYQKEVTLHPAEVWVYAPMASAQVLANHRDDALQTLRTWVKAAPDDPAATAALTSLLLDGPDASAAVEAATKGIAALPESKRKDPNLQFALGRAQVAAGDTASGSATFVALLRDSKDALMMNNAAYELSKTGTELPLAERTSRLILSRMGGESTTWTLDENQAMLRAKTALIISSWDTLGYILFREARYDEALDFIRAAWVNSEHAEEGEHLGDVYDKLGNHQESYRSYALALATIPGSSATGVKTAPGPDVKRLREKMDAQKQAGARADKLDAAAALLRLRTVSLGPANGREGTAEYLMLVSRDRVESAQALGEKPVGGGVELIRKADVKNFTPIGLDVRLAKAAVLNCHSNACSLVFEP
jgi:tetratricopeptide (TPR) repeat protein